MKTTLRTFFVLFALPSVLFCQPEPDSLWTIYRADNSSDEVGKVNISQTTYELVNDNLQFSFVSRGKIQAKGKGELDMYFAERA